MSNIFENLETIFDRLVEKIMQENNLTEKELDELMPDVIAASSAAVARQLIEPVKEYARVALPRERAEYENFQKEVFARWGVAIDLLETLEKSVSVEAIEFLETHQIKASEQNNYIFESTKRLHRRASLIATEIIHLLKGGYASGAMSRWRALHETAVISIFISTAGQEVAERYLAHELVQSYKATLHYREWFDKYAEGFDPPNYAPVSDEDFDEIKGQYDAVCATYGKEFKDDYGWANQALGLNGRVTFRDIELVVNQDKWRPYYSLANLGIHAGVKGTTFNIGVSSKDSTYLLSGPSLLGLADPGQLTATSLHTVTRALFMCYPDLRTVITIGLFEQLVGEIYQEFGSINETLEPK